MRLWLASDSSVPGPETHRYLAHPIPTPRLKRPGPGRLAARPPGSPGPRSCSCLWARRPAAHPARISYFWGIPGKCHGKHCFFVFHIYFTFSSHVFSHLFHIFVTFCFIYFSHLFSNIFFVLYFC